METRLLSRTLPIVTKEQVAAQRRDALCPSPKVQKQAAFGILSFPHEGGEGVFFWFSMGGRGSFKFISIGFEVVPVSASFWQRATLVDIQRGDDSSPGWFALMALFFKLEDLVCVGSEKSLRLCD